jgi:hypothetical protein
MRILYFLPLTLVSVALGEPAQPLVKQVSKAAPLTAIEAVQPPAPLPVQVQPIVKSEAQKTKLKASVTLEETEQIVKVRKVVTSKPVAVESYYLEDEELESPQISKEEPEVLQLDPTSLFKEAPPVVQELPVVQDLPVIPIVVERAPKPEVVPNPFPDYSQVGFPVISPVSQPGKKTLMGNVY